MADIVCIECGGYEDEPQHDPESSLWELEGHGFIPYYEDDEDEDD